MKKQKIFIVHGTNTHLLKKVDKFLRRKGYDTIILHKKPSEGKTLIEKIEKYSNVHFSVVLLTGDDKGRKAKEKGKLLLRARQNVIFELGYFMAKLERKNVFVLYEKKVDLPSDYKGMVYIEFDKREVWKRILYEELTNTKQTKIKDLVGGAKNTSKEHEENDSALRKKILVELFEESKEMTEIIKNLKSKLENTNKMNPKIEVTYWSGFRTGYLNDFMQNHRLKFSFPSNDNNKLRNYFEKIKNMIWNKSDTVLRSVPSISFKELEIIKDSIERYQDLILTAQDNNNDFNFSFQKLKYKIE